MNSFDSNVLPAVEEGFADRPRVVSIVVPVYCNRESLGQLHEEILEVSSSKFPNVDLEIVYIDDGSRDDSWSEIQRLRREYPELVSAHKLTRNFGQLSALYAGYGVARGDAIVTISADLQDPTEVIGDMVNRWLSGDDIVIANRADRLDGVLSKTTSRLAYAYARKSTPGIPQGGFDFFLMSRRAVDLLLTFKGRFRFLQGDLLWLGFPTSFIPYIRKERPYGKSGYTWSRRLANFTDLVIDSSYGPIKAMSRVGFFAALLGVFYLISILITWLTGGAPFNGWAPIMVVILVTNGFVMMMLGLVGEYLWRIHDQIRERPMHVFLESHFSDLG